MTDTEQFSEQLAAKLDKATFTIGSRECDVVSAMDTYSRHSSCRDVVVDLDNGQQFALTVRKIS